MLRSGLCYATEESTASRRGVRPWQVATWVGGGMKLAIDSTYPVREVGKAIARAAQGGMRGRVIIDVAGGF